MRLQDYLSQNAINLADFGRRVGRSSATISRLARGLNRPDWQTMNAIVEATGGAVQPNDFLAPDGMESRLK